MDGPSQMQGTVMNFVRDSEGFKWGWCCNARKEHKTQPQLYYHGVLHM